MAEEKRVTGTSLESFEQAAASAFDEIPGDPNAEGIASADVVRTWVTKGGFVGRTQYHVELLSPGEGGYTSEQAS
jgi:flavin-binding protein dodecin